jgi:tetratricopeptide (TPR) repeat protein
LRCVVSLLLVLLLSIACAPVLSAPAPPVRFGFAWDSEWTWEQLSAHVLQTAPEAAATVQRLKQVLPLAQARLLLRYLAELPAIAEVRHLPDRIAIDRRANRLPDVQKALDAALQDFAPRDDLGGMLSAAERLAVARAQTADWFMPDLTGRVYKPVPVRDKRHPRIRVRFDFRAAEALLDRLGAENTTDAEWEKLASEPIFKQLLAHRGAARLRREELMDWWRRAQDPAPLNRLYEWVYPGSYYDYGGVAVNAEGYRSLLKQIRAGQANLVDRVRARLSRFLPDDLDLDATVFFLFAGDVDGWATGSGLGIDLEHFGDDYDYLERVIAHECFHMAQSVAVLPVTTLVPEDVPDRAFHDGLLEAAWREGIASYVGTVWTASPAPDDLARSFKLFETACDALYRSHDMVAYRQRIRGGLNMAGPLYHVGWRMAQVIEKELGPEAVTELQTLGPGVFFARYIEAYHRATFAEVPAAQRFRPDIEEAIRRVAAGLDAPALLEAARIARIPEQERARDSANRFLEAREHDPQAALALVYLGDALARRRRDFAQAERLMVPGLKMLGAQAGDLVRREGYLLLSLRAAPQALAVFQAGVEIAPNDPQRRYFVGEAYRLSGDPERARAAYRRALALDAQYEPARRALALLGDAPGR